ncbi:MAG: cobalt transporter CbiM [Cyanobacteria bacterium P01_F01_bin.150]
MHIPDGILPAQVSVVGYAIAVPLIGYSLRRIELQSRRHPAGVSRTIPKAALLTATFFVASSLYLPGPPPLGTIHFLMNGLLGVVLGYYAIPAIVSGLLFQALLLGHGGLTTLGLNTLLLGVPALLAHHLFESRHWLIPKMTAGGRVPTRMLHGLFGGVAGFVGVMGAALLFFALVISTIPADINAATEQAAISLMTLVNLPLAIIEGLFTGSFVVFILRTKPELLDSPGDRTRGQSSHPQAHQQTEQRTG